MSDISQGNTKCESISEDKQKYIRKKTYEGQTYIDHIKNTLLYNISKFCAVTSRILLLFGRF